MSDSPQELLDLIFAASHQIYYDHDVASGTIQWGGQVERVLGFRPDELTGGIRQWLDLLHPDDNEVASLPAGQGITSYESEYRFRRKDGQYIWVHDRGVCQRDENGKPVRTIGLQEDVSDRKQAEAALHDMEERYRVLVERVQGAVFFIQDGRFVFANEAFAKILGYSPAEIVGQPLVNFVAPESMETVIGNYRSRMRGEEVLNEYEAHLLHKNGSHRLTVISADVVKVQGKEGSLGTIIDITESRKVEAELRLKDSAMASSINGVMINALDGGALYANEAFCKMFGYSQEEAMRLTPFDLGYDSADNRRIMQIVQAQGAFVGEELARHKDGHSFPVQISASIIVGADGQPVAMMASFVDVTESRQAALALQQSEQKYRSLIETTDTGFVTIDDHGYVIDANPRYVRLTGRQTIEDIRGHNVAEWTAEYEKERNLKAIIQCFERGYIHNLEIDYIDPAGRITPVEINATVFQGDTGVQVLTLCRDISERRRASDAIKQLSHEMSLVLDTAGEGIYRMDADGKIIFINQAGTQMLGWSQDELVGRHNHPLMHHSRPDGSPYPEDECPIHHACRQTGVAAHGEEFFWRKDGTGFPVDFTATPIIEEGLNVGAVVTFTDITERKQAQIELAESAATFRTLFEKSGDASFLLENGTLADCNEALVRQLRATSREQLLQLTPGSISPERQPDGRSSAEKADEMIAIALEKGSHRFEWTHRRRDGEDYPAEVLLTPVRLPGDRLVVHTVVRDITVRKQAERALRESFERRGYQVGVSTEISQEIAGAVELGDLFKRVVTLIKERLGYYHTQVLRYDPHQDAVVLIAGYGETGEKMLASKHKMPMGVGLIGTAAATGHTVMRPDVSTDPGWRSNPLLPDTKGEISLPIKLHGQVLGVLDVQSDRKNALTDDDRLLLEGLCGQIAIAMEQTRLRQEMAARLQELDVLYRSASRSGWEAARRVGLFSGGYRFDRTDTVPLDSSWTYADPSSPEPAQGSTAISSLTVRGGEVIGSLGVVEDPQHPLSQEDRSLIEQISDQVALALESARLFAQTQATLGQTEALYAGSERVVRATTADEALSALIEATELSQFDLGSIMLFNRPWAEEQPETGQIFADWHKPDVAVSLPPGAVFPIAQFPFTRFLRRDAPVYIRDVENDERMDTASRDVIRPLGNCVVVFPLLVGDQWIGLITVFGMTSVEISSDQIRQIGSLVGQAATVVQSIRLYDQTQAALAETQGLYRLTSRLTAAGDLVEIVAIAAEESRIPEINCSVLMLFERSPQGEIRTITVRANWHSGQGRPPTPVGTQYPEEFVHQVVDRLLCSEPLFIEETDEPTRQQGIASMVILPLWIAGQQAGVLLLQSEAPLHFTEPQRHPAAALAQQVTIAVQNRVLFDQVRSALAATERSQQFLRTLIDNIPNPIFFKDTRGAYIGFNRAFLEYLGKTEDELLGKTVFDLQTDQELAARYHQMDVELFENPGVQVYEARVRYADGSLRDVIFNKATFENAEGVLGGLVGAMVDISDRKQVETNLRESQVRLSEALDIARLAYWEFDFITGMFTFDQKYYDMLGITADEEGGYSMTAQRFAEIYTHPEDAVIFGTEIQKALESTDPDYSRQFEVRNLRKDGAEVVVSVRFRIFKDSEARTVRMVGANQDITERKRAEAVIARRARELSKVAEISTTMSSVLDPDQVLQIAVDLTRQSFTLYHAHIYLLNENEDALVLAAGAGDVGRKMIAQGWQIALDREKSVVARSARTHQAVIVNDVRSDPGFLPNDLLPDTRSEMAVPLLIGSQVVGILDVQSDLLGRFGEEDVNILTTLSVQIAVTLQNARTYAQTQRQAEHEALINAISQRIQSTTSVETALQVAVRELGRALGASKTSVQLGLQRRAKL